MNALETMEVTVEQQSRFEKKQPGKRIVGIKSVDRRRMDEMRIEVGVKQSFKEWEMKHWYREQMPRTWRGKGGEEDRNSDGGLQ